MYVQQNVSLKPYNTFGIEVPAEYFIELDDTDEVIEALQDTSLPVKKNIIGGGSNILLTKPVAGLTLLNKTKGIEKIKEDEDHVWLNVSSGEVWHELVCNLQWLGRYRKPGTYSRHRGCCSYAEYRCIRY
jgi:UDP-N-acetylmuramate dehydrogenase